MSSGPEHYRESETCTRQACASDEAGDIADAHVWIGLAQVHATLALAAATALQAGADEMYADDKAAWVTAASEEAKRETA